MNVRSEILQFLPAPQAFASSLPNDDAPIWRQGLEEFAQPQIAEKGDYPLRESQVIAWNGLADQRVGLIQGPPGTGKTYVLAWMALDYLQGRRAAGLPCRILVNAFTLNAIGNLLDAIQSKAARYVPSPPDVVYLGSQADGGLNPAIRHISFRQRGATAEAWEALHSDHQVVGSSVWALNKPLVAGDPTVTDGPTSPLFHLVCIDEASQMVVSNGLMALAGLALGGRVLVAGDDKQLPPVRAVHNQEIDGRRLGGSLYDFLKCAQVAEFPLDETFRLNAPLTGFPESKF
jgi:ATP-dependent exoDNAse (exonuclease V) alpha subunit